MTAEAACPQATTIGAALRTRKRAVAETLAAHLQAASVRPPGHVIVNVQLCLKATKKPASVETPYLTVTIFDATDYGDPATAYQQAIADDQRPFPIQHVQMNDVIEVIACASAQEALIQVESYAADPVSGPRSGRT